MEHLNWLLIIPLQSCPWKEHMGHLSESQCCMWLQEFNTCRGYIDVPLSKICVKKYQQIYDVGKTQRYTWKQNWEETHSFLNIMQGININALHDTLFKTGDEEKSVIAREINRKTCEDHVKNGKTHQEQSDTVLIGFVEGPLSFDHATES